MDELVIRSSTGEIEFSLRWVADGSTDQAAHATLGHLRLALRGQPVWHGDDADTGFEWTWIELLEFLADSWRYLVLEDGTPLGVAVDTAPRMLAAAEAATQIAGPAVADTDLEQLHAFVATHDLSGAVQGADLPPAWVVRDGLTGWLCTDHWTGRAPAAELTQMLNELGEAIAARLVACSDARAVAAVGSWRARENLSRLDVIEAATGFPRNLVEEVESAFFARDERNWLAPESDVLLAAARMVGPLPLDTLDPILQAIRGMPSVNTPELDQLSEAATAVVQAAADERPYEQGYVLATWLRAEPRTVQVGGRIDPHALLHRWGVPVVEVALELASLDAIGCWGSQHGPGVVINVDGAHANSKAGRRATLAHEVAHLLVDRKGSLPLAEVLGGRTALHVEQRARAFAAELLLPRTLAVSEFLDSDSDYELLLKRVMKSFGVSAELIAWQVRNSRAPLEAGLRRFLSQYVPQPHQY